MAKLRKGHIALKLFRCSLMFFFIRWFLIGPRQEFGSSTWIPFWNFWNKSSLLYCVWYYKALSNLVNQSVVCSPFFIFWSALCVWAYQTWHTLQFFSKMIQHVQPISITCLQNFSKDQFSPLTRLTCCPRVFSRQLKKGALGGVQRAGIRPLPPQVC